MKKRLTALALAFAMVLGTVALAAGAEKSITVSPMTLTINGQEVTPTKSNGAAAEVFAYDGATYVPLRYLSELLGIDVEWDKNDPNTAKLVSDELTPPSGQTENLTTDVVVVGSGISGSAAAVAAAQNGARVILVEKQGYIGGSLVASPGNMAVAEVAENKSYHLEPSDDTLDAAFARWSQKIADTQPASVMDETRVRVLMTESMKTLNWYSDMGAAFSPMMTVEANGLKTYRPNVPTMDSGLGGAQLMALLRSVGEANGAVYMTDTAATSLIMENGKVAGITARTTGGEISIHAKKVILACGGFGGNDEMLLKSIPGLAETGYYYQGLASNTGDGIQMAKQVGAATYDEDWLVATTLAPHGDLIAANRQFGKLVEGMVYTVSPSGDAIPGASIADQLLVNTRGVRVVNEAGNKSSQLAALMDSASAPYYALYSGVSGELEEILNSGLDTGHVVKAADLAELARAVQMDAKTLEQTVAAYNKAAASGTDSQFGKSADRMHQIAAQGPYYLCRVVPSFVATMGGLLTDENYQVLDAYGNAFDGLYAVGEMAHRFLYTRNFITGASNGFCGTMGRWAGEHAAKTVS